MASRKSETYQIEPRT